MSREQKLTSKIRTELLTALKFMNRFKLTEFEFEDKQKGESLKLSRSSQDSSSPLLEGRSKEIPGVIFSPAVGRISWKVKENAFVEEDSTVAEIEKHQSIVEVKAPISGTITELLPAAPVEFGEKLAVIEYRESDKDE